MMTIRQTGAKGDFVDTLLQVVALDDVVGLVLYSVAISIALASLSGASGFSFETLGKPVVLNLLVVGDEPGSKREKAQALGIRMVDEAGFLALLQADNEVTASSSENAAQDSE